MFSGQVWRGWEWRGIRGGFVLGLLPSVWNETGLCLSAYRGTVGSFCESTLQTVKHFSRVRQDYYHYFQMVPYRLAKLTCPQRVTQATKSLVSRISLPSLCKESSQSNAGGFYDSVLKLCIIQNRVLYWFFYLADQKYIFTYS